MGTRSLICVVADGDFKVAQYAQFDGYPGGQGLDILNFLKKDYDAHKFTAGLKKCTWITTEELKARFDEAEKAEAPLSAKFPESSRETGANILALIQNSDGLKLTDKREFAKESLYCEWAYVIDLDKGIFEVYEGLNKKKLPAGARFYSEEKIDGYYPVKLVKTFALNELPSTEEFVAITLVPLY